jgi:hypothetical protein
VASSTAGRIAQPMAVNLATMVYERVKQDIFDYNIPVSQIHQQILQNCQGDQDKIQPSI